MTWRQFTDALREVAIHGRLAKLPPDVRTSMYALRMVQGSEADDDGVTLTAIGRAWYQRAIVDRENERILEQYAPLIGGMFGERS